MSSCHSQTNREIIDETTHKVIAALKNKNPTDFKNLIGVSNLRIIGKDDETIGYDVNKYNLLLNQAFNKADEVPFNITGLFNGMGQTVVRIKFPQSMADSSGVKTLHLNIYFGPPQIVSLRKISGYELIQDNSDSTEFKKQ
ncbi:MAG: hypothetical protein C0446_09900 [Chitinophaga sp.]|nr:hypothetical protein [Chitinophaga sp.]